MAREVFSERDFLYQELMTALETAETKAEPRLMMIETFHKLLYKNSTSVRPKSVTNQIEIKEDFAKIAAMFSEEGHEVSREEPRYKLHCAQLHMAALWWYHMLTPSAKPFVEAELQVSVAYNSLRQNNVFQNYWNLLLSDRGRNYVYPSSIRSESDDTSTPSADDITYAYNTYNNEINGFYEDTFLIERDLFGARRFFPVAGGGTIMFGNLTVGRIGFNEETAAVLLEGCCPAFSTHGNMELHRYGTPGKAMWTTWDVRCKPEDDPPMYTESFFCPELALNNCSKANINNPQYRFTPEFAGPIIQRKDEGIKRDFERPVGCQRSAILDGRTSFELPVIKKDYSWLGWMLTKIR